MGGKEDPIDVRELRRDEEKISAGKSDDEIIEALRRLGD